MNVALDSGDTRPTTRLGDWYATDIVIERKQLVLCVSSESRISVIVQAAPYATIPARLAKEVAAVLKVLGFSESIIGNELREMTEWSVSKTLDRSITGTLKQFKQDLKMHSDFGQTNASSNLDRSILLCKTPCLTMTPSFPLAKAQEIFSQPQLKLLR